MSNRIVVVLAILCIGTRVFGQGPQFAIDKKSCPPQGKTKGGAAISKTSDDGLRNLAKRHLPGGTQPVSLEIADFKTLQDDTNQITGVDAATTKTKFTVTTRLHLQHLNTAHGTVSEGDLVQVDAFVTKARQEGAESVNCAAADGTDIHLAIGATDLASEFEGIVAEMIPQIVKQPGWHDATVLNRIHAAKLRVLVLGGLTYDNEHYVNADPLHKKSGQPARMSLWEIHPITAFFVCESGNCNPAQHSDWTH